MKRITIIVLSIIFTAVSLYAQSAVTPFYERNDFLFASPGALKFGLYGYDNPALLSYVRQPDVLFTWSDAVTNRYDEFRRWGLFFGFPHFGFGSVHQELPAGHYADYTLSFAGGDRTFSSGMSYSWTITNNPLLDKSSLITSGYLFRPCSHISAGMTWAQAINTSGYEIEGDAAVRPLGNEKITLFADYIFHRTPQLHKDMWSAGAAFEMLPGVRITGRYFNTDAFSLGMQFSLGRLELQTQAQYDNKGHYSYNSYGVRLGAYDRNIFDTYFAKKERFYEINQTGRIDYQKYVLFDRTQVLSELLDAIEAAKNDPHTAGIAVNTSGLEMNSEKGWELREKLKDFRKSGKKVFIFIDNAGIDLYHFASVADKVVMDPLGMLSLEGYLWGRTYLKGTLEKIGLGFDEWRFYKYKSAYEVLSRDNMSEADSVQWLELIKDWYKTTREDICRSRNLTGGQFDTLVNDKVVLLARQAQEAGLIDSIGRWDMVKEMAKQETGNDAPFISSNLLLKYNLPYDNRWSEPPRIALIYALGTCAMDEGITARRLVRDVESAADDSRVKAIVLRVDSPGGDGIASDYIAEALKKAKGKKPVIVSQGYVAGSGGYWLSMYADTIVAAPGTITGSIGATGGWIYNKGLKESLGMATDYVGVGEHADLGFGFRLPFIGLGVPDRNLTAAERAVLEADIKVIYKEFVGKVASGRKKSVEYIDFVGQGRVWSGLAGKQNGLVDVIGGLETAIDIAKERAGIPKEKEVTIVEMPKKGLINFSAFMPRLFGIETKVQTDPTVEMLKFRLEHNGRPLPMLPLEDCNMSGYSE